MEGEISKSMAVNTRPSYKFEINGYWLMLDPNADEETVQYVKDITINCATCKHSETDAFDMPCMSCIRMSEFGTNKWEAKQ